MMSEQANRHFVAFQRKHLVKMADVLKMADA